MPALLDTNILLYSISEAPADAVKRPVAERLALTDSSVLSAQVIQEFYVQATRRSRPDPLSHVEAVSLIERWSRYSIVTLTISLIGRALELRAKTNFAYWDCAVIAAAIAGGCDVLYTEDMQHGREVEGVRIVNPFAA